MDGGFPWSPHPEHRSRWLSLHHGQSHLWRSTRHRPRPLTFATFYQRPAILDPVTKCRLFADDCLVHRTMHTIEDQIQMQRDLDALQNWSEIWGMQFNAKTCNVMTLVCGANPLSYFYQLNNTILDKVNACDYLGITISENFTWTDHITANTKKANARLGLLHWNLRPWSVQHMCHWRVPSWNTPPPSGTSLWRRIRKPWRRYIAEQHSGYEATTGSGQVSQPFWQTSDSLLWRSDKKTRSSC